ncbi:MAG: nucleotide exchange factor GrpE [Acetanaerobacterium sp.]
MTDSSEPKPTAPGQPAPPETAEQKAEKPKKPKGAPKELDLLKKQLEEAQEAAEKQTSQLEELGNRLLRTMAEYDNYRKRTQREKEQIYPEAIRTSVEAFLPVLDSFERALAVETADEEFKKGVAMIFTAMQDACKKLGVEEIAAKDQPFDPEMHNAVMHIDDDSLPENTVCEVFAKGYCLGDLVIRHAVVKVAN